MNSKKPNDDTKIDIMSFNKDKLNLINNDFNKLNMGLVNKNIKNKTKKQ